MKSIYIFCITLTISCSNIQQKNHIPDTINSDSLVLVSDTFYNKIEESTVLDSITCGLNFKKGVNYIAEKSRIDKIKNKLNLKYLSSSTEEEQNLLLDSASIIFSDILLNNLIPYWYGTVWDFNGHTSKPNEGEIACGYFVSTTLKDLGLNINRYKLAQQNPKNEAKSIAIELDNLQQLEFRNLKDLKEGIYFVGLDNHVGYLYKKANDTYFIHSNYIEGKVMIENTIHSEAFKSSVYYISKITYNKALIKKWLKNEYVMVQT